jgi:hypothetical protein
MKMNQMKQIEKFINKKRKIYLNELNYIDYNYDNYDEFEIDLLFLLSTLYNRVRLYNNRNDKQLIIID